MTATQQVKNKTKMIEKKGESPWGTKIRNDSFSEEFEILRENVFIHNKYLLGIFFEPQTWTYFYGTFILAEEDNK
jgi:hypothetical protein